MNISTCSQTNSRFAAFWLNFLSLTTISTMLSGLVMVLAPDLTKQAFGLMVFQNPAQFETFDKTAIAYIELAHAVMGSLMVGWGALMYLLVQGLLVNGRKEALGMISMSLLLWYVPDTAFSLHSGFWQNAVLNTGFAVMYAIPLVALRKHVR